MNPQRLKRIAALNEADLTGSLQWARIDTDNGWAWELTGPCLDGTEFHVLFGELDRGGMGLDVPGTDTPDPEAALSAIESYLGLDLAPPYLTLVE